MTARPLLLAVALLVATGPAPAEPAASPVPATAASSAAAATTGDARPERTPEAAAMPPPAYAARLREQTARVLAGPDFHERDTVRTPVLRDWLRKWLHRDETRSKPSTPPDLAWLATVFQYLAVALLALALGWLLWRGWQWLAPQVRGRTPSRGDRTAEPLYLALPDAPLPDAVAGAAEAAWRAGDAALALSLLYRGAVRALARHHGIELPDSATEGECLRQAQLSEAAVVAAGFAPIVRAWMGLAYARRTPDDFGALLQLYSRHFEPTPGDAA